MNGHSSAWQLSAHPQAGHSVRALSQLSNSIVENANIWLNVLDAQLNIVLWNKVAERISGYSREEVLGHHRIWEWRYLPKLAHLG